MLKIFVYKNTGYKCKCTFVKDKMSHRNYYYCYYYAVFFLCVLIANGSAELAIYMYTTLNFDIHHTSIHLLSTKLYLISKHSLTFFKLLNAKSSIVKKNKDEGLNKFKCVLRKKRKTQEKNFPGFCNARLRDSILQLILYYKCLCYT